MDHSQRGRGGQAPDWGLIIVAMNAVGKKIMEAFAKRTGR
jgi:hypothetical protein